MKYRLGDICTITKGETGIMKAIPGPYTMVALGEANKTHNEFQFDTKAVIIPLVSSTGHGHASMKRVKYQEGKFALGNILCAVVPKNENVVLAKYLHIYLHWNREELLVSQMKGMANVSLSLNKIADVIVTVPSIEKQKEIVELEQQLVAKEIEAEKLYADQLTQLENLNQTILQEALQGKLVPQSAKDEPASELLKRIKTEKETLCQAQGKGKKEKQLSPIKLEEIPFEIPVNWVWCRLGDIGEPTIGIIFKPSEVGKIGIPVLRANNIQNNQIDSSNLIFVNTEVREKQIANIGDILICVRSGSNNLIGKSALIEKGGMSFGAFMSLYRSAFNQYVYHFQ
jgi:type I restriction enzyme S subunit